MIHAYLKIGEKQDIVFPHFILERNEIIPIPRSHTCLVPVVISARYLVQPYLIGFLVTRNREINGEPTVTLRPSYFNTNIKKFVVTLFFSLKQTNHTLKGEISILGLCLLSQRGFFGHFPTIRDYFKTSEE